MLSGPHWSMSPKEHDPDMSGRYTTETEPNITWSEMLLNAKGRNQNETQENRYLFPLIQFENLMRCQWHEQRNQPPYTLPTRTEFRGNKRLTSLSISDKSLCCYIWCYMSLKATKQAHEEKNTSLSYSILLNLVVENINLFLFFFLNWTLWTNAALSIYPFVHLIIKSVIYSIEDSRKCVTTQQQMSGRCCIMARSFWAEQPMHKIWMTKYEYCLSTRQARRCAKRRPSWRLNGFFNWLYFSNKY